jgi:hypothetical protein
MRSVFGVLSLLVALGIVTVLVKKQLAVPQASADPAAPASPQQTQQQYKQALDAAMQAAQPPKDRSADEK